MINTCLKPLYSWIFYYCKGVVVNFLPFLVCEIKFFYLSVHHSFYSVHYTLLVSLTFVAEKNYDMTWYEWILYFLWLILFV